MKPPPFRMVQSRQWTDLLVSDTEMPKYLKLTTAAFAFGDASGHARVREFAPEGLARWLGTNLHTGEIACKVGADGELVETEQNPRRVLRQAVERGQLSALSNLNCLVLPTTTGVGRGFVMPDRCPVLHQSEARRRRRGDARQVLKAA